MTVFFLPLPGSKILPGKPFFQHQKHIASHSEERGIFWSDLYSFSYHPEVFQRFNEKMVVKSLTQLDCWISDVSSMFFSLEGPWKIQVLTQLVEKTRISPALVPSKKTPKRCCALWILEWGSSHGNADLKSKMTMTLRQRFGSRIVCLFSFRGKTWNFFCLSWETFRKMKKELSGSLC